ncbi:titin homolog isoform X1 [Astyanax mexicanus]|uniref:titin homolog isoform X1 n=1 Tax=Astyanax mexicanus TaxID=7994 RepID=UPI0020CB0EC9|nr:titin homolog isoform X1 [Astyanax mexicanus]
MKSSKDINLDTYNLSLITAKEDVLNPRTSTNWALFAYDGVTNRLKLADSGAGGVSEIVDKLHPRRPLYGLCRVDQPKTTRTHIAMIIWVGKDVDDYRRAQCVAHVPAIKSFFKEAHFFLPASSLEDVTEERIFSVASTVTAMTERDKARRVIRKEDREEKVGTNYKRTIAAAEIHKTIRENFWAQAEREEEARKEEERRRVAEDRRRRERERVQQERREAEERERRMNEKLKKIQEQRRLQAEADAEKLKQEQLKWAEQQKEFEDEMKSRFSHSESVEKAVEAAVLVSQRKQNPREFFRQLSLSSNDPQPNPPSPSPTVRSSNRRIHRSLTDVILFTKSSSSSPSSPGSPKPLSPFFPSSPTSHSPTPLSQPQHTHSSLTTIPPYIPAYSPTKSPAVDSPSPTSRHTGVFTSDPCDPMEVFPPPPRDLKMVSPLPPIGPREVFPTPPSGPREVFPPPPSGLRDVFPAPSSGPKDVFLATSSGPRDVFLATSSGPRDVFPAPPSGPREVFPPPCSGPIKVLLLPPSGPREVFPPPPSGPRDVFPPPPSGPRDVFPLPPPSGPKDVFPPPTSGPKDVFPPPPSGPREVFPLPPSGPKEVFPPPSSSPREAISSPPRGQKVISPLPPSGQTAMYTSPSNPIEFFRPHPGDLTVGSLSPPQGQKVVSLLHDSGPMEVFKSPISNQTVSTLAAPSTASSTSLQPCSPENPNISLTELVEGLTFYPPPSAADITTQSLVQPETENLAPPQVQPTGPAAQNSVCDLVLTNTQGSSPDQVQPDMPSATVSFPMISSAQPVPRPPSRPLPALPVREFCSLDSMIPTDEEAERNDGEVTGEKEPWVTAQASMISIPEEEDDYVDKRGLEEEKQLKVGKDRDVRKKEVVMEQEEEKQEKMHKEKDEEMFSLAEQKNVGFKAENVESQMVEERDEGITVVEEENLGKREHNPEDGIATQVSMISIPKEESVDGKPKEENEASVKDKVEIEKKDSDIFNEKKDRDKEVPQEGRELTENNDDGKVEKGQEGMMGQEEEKLEEVHREKDGEILSPCKEKNKDMVNAENLESKLVGERDEGIKEEEQNLEITKTNPEQWFATQPSMISSPKEESVGGQAKNENKDLKENKAGKENKDSEIQNERKGRDEDTPEDAKEPTEKKDDGKVGEVQMEVMETKEVKQVMVQSEKDKEMVPSSEAENEDTEANNVESKAEEERNEGMKEEEEKLEMTKNNPEHWIASQSSIISIPKEKSVDGEAKFENEDLKKDEVVRKKKDSDIRNERKERDEEAPQEGRELTEKTDDAKVSKEQKGMMEQEEKTQEKVHGEKDEQILRPLEETSKSMECENLESKMVGERDEGIKEEEEKLEKIENDPKYGTAAQACMISIPKEESIDGQAKDENKVPKDNEVGPEKKDSKLLKIEKKDDRKVGEEQAEVMEPEKKTQEKVHGEKDEQILLPWEETSKSMEGENLDSKIVEERNEGMKGEEEKLEKKENDPENWIAAQVSLISIPMQESVDGESTDENKERKENEAGLKKEDSNILKIEKKDDGKVGEEQAEVMEQEEKTQEKVHREKDEQILLPLEETRKSMEGENLDSKIVEERNEGMKEEEEKLEKTENDPENWIAAQVSLISIPKEESGDGQAKDENKDPKENEAGRKRHEEAVKGLEEGKEQEEKTESLWDQEKLVDERVADAEKVNEEEEDGTMGEGLIDRVTEVGKDAETDVEVTAKDEIENEIKNEEKEAENVKGEDDINGQTSDMDWREKNIERVDAELEKVVYEVKNTEPTEEERSERDTNEDGQMVEAKESLDEGEEAERIENKVESKRKSEPFDNWENNKNAREFEEFEKSSEPEMNQEATASGQQHRDEVKTVEILKDDTVNKREPGEQNDKVAQTDVSEKLEEIAEHTSPCGHLQTAQESAENPMQSENLPIGKCLTIEVESNLSVSDDQPDSLPSVLAENLVATILESLATSIESSVTEATVFEQTFPASPSENSREIEDSSVDEACEEAKEMEEVESKDESAEEESETEELDCEPAEWHTAELKTRHISTDSFEKLGSEDVGDELEDTDCTTSTDTNQLTSSSGLDSVQELSYVDDGQEASYEEAQEPDYDSDSVEEATEHAFLPAIDVNLKVMDTETVSDTENKIKDK